MNPFWFAQAFRRFPIVGLAYHLWRACKFAARLARKY